MKRRKSNGSATTPITGHVDSWDGSHLRGWVFDREHPNRRLTVDVLQGGQCILRLKADRYRADLAGAGLGDGCHAFDVPLPVSLFDAPRVVLQICTQEDGRELIGSPIVQTNSTAPLDPAILSDIGQRIDALASAAQTPGSLDWLFTWLQQHQDVVYKRQTELLQAAVQRDVWFANVFAQNDSLPALMHNAAKMTVERYDSLRIDSGADPIVTVIIPAFNNFAYTYRCVQSLVSHDARTPFEILVVDDASTDETLFAGLVLHGDIRVVRNTRNIGFLKSVNTAASLARGRLLFLLNNDTEVQAGWLDPLVDSFARDPAIGIAGSKLIYPNGLLQEAGGIIWRDGSGLNFGNRGDPNDPQYCFMRDADYVSGAALMIERALFDAVDGLSEEFAPAYYEDTDLCFKARAAGRRVVVQPQSCVMHHEGITSGTDVRGGMKRHQRINHRTFTLKWLDTLQAHGLSDSNPAAESERGVTKRVLFIDDTVPTPDQDAGSNAAVAHMRALQRIGFKVSFISDNVLHVPRYTGQLEAAGIQCYYSPYTHSVEELLKSGAATFDLFYVHRFGNMQRYAALIREHFPQARIVYSVADLHHLRMEREAQVTKDKALRQQAATFRKNELAMVKAADSVIVHSSFERDLIKVFDPAVNVHAIPWTVTPQPTPIPFAQRARIAFIGGYNHPPNVDAALWLAETILPLVRRRIPDIECLLIGSQMPDSLRALKQPGLRIVGHVEALQPTLERLRLTVAPLRYGAGMKGKVLTSLAAGLPCVATPCAVEGMDLPEPCNALVAETASSFAAQIVRAYHDEALNAAIAQAGLAYIASNCSPAKVEALLRAASTPPAAPAKKPRHTASTASRSGNQRVLSTSEAKTARARTSDSRSPG